MDILKIIENDHKKTAEGLEKLTGEKGSSAAIKKKTWAPLQKDLIAHIQAEEEVFYPPLRDEIEDKILEAIEEHQLVRMAISVLNETPEDDETWVPKLKVIKENIEHHVEEEEGEIFEAARSKFSKEELNEMGRQFEEAKGKAPSRK